MMCKKISVFDEPNDFSLVQGGPLFQLLMRAKLLKPPTDFLTRRIAVIVFIAWSPLLLLSVISSHAVGESIMSFLCDVGVQARFFLAVPLLLAAEVLVHRRLKLVVRQFIDRGIITPEDQPRFENIIASAMRLRSSAIAEALMVGVIVIGYWFGKRHIARWYATPVGDLTQLTAAGYWYLYVSLTIIRLLLLRWYFRLFVWYRFLWQVSRHLRLQLNALHPDRAGGLAFISNSVFAFAPVLLAHIVGLAGTYGNKIWHEGATLAQFKVEIAAWVVFLIALVIAPLFFFIVQLAEAKRTGLREYGIVASRYVADFRRKWIEGQSAKDESLVGTADIQSLADLSNSFQVVREMRIVPLGRGTVLRLAVLVVLPLLPLVLTMIPLEQLIERALGVFF